MTVERVLVVDDDEALLNLMALALRRRGYQVEQALDGFSALKLLAAEPGCSVLLTDLMMPAVSGLELLRAAKQVAPDVEVVLMTAYGTAQTAWCPAKVADGGPVEARSGG